MEKVEKLVLHEVGMRDGLQIEQKIVPTETKIKWIESLISSGADIIQLGSFVHPRRVPQMADTDAVFRHFISSPKKRNCVFSGLVLNEKGLERGMACGVEMFCMGVSASETHSKKNTGMSVSEAAERITKMAQEALKAGKKVQVSVQSAFGCGYEGAISEERVIRIVERFLGAGLRQISLADTAGMANPAQVEKLFEKIRSLAANVECACHFHDAWGLGLANVYAACRSGVRYFESAFAGMGGCPFTRRGMGNVCSEDMINMFMKMGVLGDVDIDAIISVSKEAEDFFGRKLPGILYKTKDGKKEEVSK